MWNDFNAKYETGDGVVDGYTILHSVMKLIRHKSGGGSGYIVPHAHHVMEYFGPIVICHLKRKIEFRMIGMEATQ